MQIDAPSDAFLEIDGNRVLTTTAGTPPTEGRVVMTRGLHTVRLHGTLENESGQVDLRWGTDNGPLVPVGREFMWGGPQGALEGVVYAVGGPQSWIVPDQLPFENTTPLALRHDAVFSWINLTYGLQSGSNPFAVWRGKFLAPTDGTYYFEAFTPGAVSIRIDDELVGVSNVPGTENRWPVNVSLAKGEHTFEMRFAGTQDNAPFQLMWQPPGKARTIFSPDALLPAESGAWVASPDKPVGSPDSSLLHSMLPKSVEVVATAPVDGWSQALGIALLADGGFAIGDSGAHKLIIYGTDGKPQAAWGGGATGDDTFNDVSDLATAPDGSIVALDAENADIRLFDTSGNQTLRIPREKVGLTHARGIAIGPDGKYYVADTGGSRVVRINQSGDVETTYQQGVGAIATLNQPMDVAVTPDGMVYAVDLLGRVVQFDQSGTALKEWKVLIGGSRGGSKLAVWGGLIVVSNPDAGSLSALDPQSGIVLRLGTPDGGPLGLNGPTGLAVSSGGRLYVVDSANNRVAVIKEVGAP